MKKYLMFNWAFIYFFGSLWSGGQNALADQQEFQAAKSGNAFLDIGTGARAVAMGEAFTGIADDVSSIYWNPAGLGQMKNPQVLLMHNQWFQNVIFEYGAVAVPLWKGGVLGLSAIYVGYGSMDKLDESGQDVGSFTAYDLNISAAYGMKFSDNLLAGVGIKAPMTVIDSEATYSFAADLGVLYKVPGWEILNIGLNIMNLGTNIGDATQPSQVKLGLGLIEAVAGLKIGVDLGQRLFEDSLQVNLGAEYLIMGILAPRVGYKITAEENRLGSGIVGLTVGLGLCHTFNDFGLGLDYAYVPYGDLGDTHRIALSIEFGAQNSQTSTSTSWSQSTSPPQQAKVSYGSTASGTDNAETYAYQTYQKPKPTVAKLRPPTKVYLKKVGSRIKVSWQSSTSRQRYGYNVYMKKGKNGKYFKVNSRVIRKNSFTSKKMPRKRTYYFIVKTVDKNGRQSRGTVPKKLYL